MKIIVDIIFSRRSMWLCNKTNCFFGYSTA